MANSGFPVAQLESGHISELVDHFVGFISYKYYSHMFVESCEMKGTHSLLISVVCIVQKGFAS